MSTGLFFLFFSCKKAYYLDKYYRYRYLVEVTQKVLLMIVQNLSQIVPLCLVLVSLPHCPHQTLRLDPTPPPLVKTGHTVPRSGEESEESWESNMSLRHSSAPCAHSFCLENSYERVHHELILLEDNIFVCLPGNSRPFFLPSSGLPLLCSKKKYAQYRGSSSPSCIQDSVGLST